MRGILEKTGVFILVALTVFSSLLLTSCNRSFDETEVLEEGEKLLKRAEMLNIVYFGSGIEYHETDEGVGYYYKANTQHLEKLGFDTIEELKKITDETFSKRYAESIYSTVLSSLTSDTSIISPARYYQVFDEKTGAPTHIMVYSKYNNLLKSSVTYDYSTLRVEGSKKQRVNLLIDATVTNADGKSQSVTVTVTLVEDESGWRIDNHTFANYSDYADIYQDLEAQDIKKRK
jgi:hypothetical protein